MTVIELDTIFYQTPPEVIQGSPEWFAQRLGKATASRIADVVATTKSGYSTSRYNYAVELATERMSGVPYPKYQNDAMRHGTENEPKARDAFAFLQGVTVEQVGFIQHPTIEMSGASPDGLIGSDETLEIKCPYISGVHVETLNSEKIDARYLTQIQYQLAVTGRRACWFVSYDPRLEARYQLFSKRIPRDDMVIDRLNKEVVLFLSEVDMIVANINRKYPKS